MPVFWLFENPKTRANGMFAGMSSVLSEMPKSPKIANVTKALTRQSIGTQALSDIKNT
jgi:hypothetical protein